MIDGRINVTESGLRTVGRVSLNDGPLDAGKITNHEQTQLDWLEHQVEEAIIAADPTWLQE